MRLSVFFGAAVTSVVWLAGVRGGASDLADDPKTVVLSIHDGRLEVSDSGSDADAGAVGKNMLRITCDELRIRTRRRPEGKRSYVIEWAGKVEATDFIGQADRIVYDELYDRLILETDRPGRSATLWRNGGAGKPDEVKGRRIFYRLGSNDVRIEGSAERPVIGLDDH